VHSELCACCHNVEDGQKGKQDAQIIFWKFPKAKTAAEHICDEINNAIKSHLPETN